MNSLTHPVAPEEIMALLDGELTAPEAKAVEAHIDECAECSVLRDELRGTSEALHAWAGPEFSGEAVQAVEEKIERADAKSRANRPRSYTSLSFRNWRLWAIGGGGAVAVTLVYVAVGARWSLLTDDIVRARRCPRRRSWPITSKIRTGRFNLLQFRTTAGG